MSAPSPDPRLTELEHASALEARYYAEPAWLAHEQASVFAASWQLLAHAAQLAGPGDHVVREINGRPLILVRGEEGRLRAFDNVCRHRAGPLALCDGRAARALQCRYHGWTYALDGRLRAATEMQEARGFELSEVRLPEHAVHEWEGLVFVALNGQAPPFETVFAGIRERIAPMQLGQLVHRASQVYEVACNWKVYVDNFLEGYHLPFVHPALTRVVDYREYETELFPWYSLQHAPIRTGQGPYGEGQAWYFFVFPNIMLNVVPGRLQTNRVVPLGVDRCRVEFEHFYGAGGSAEAQFEADQVFTEQVQQEDMAICAQVQRALASGSYQSGHLCPRRESGVWHFQQLLRAAYSRV